MTHDASTDLDPAWSPDGRLDLLRLEPRRRESTSGASRSARDGQAAGAARAAHHRRGRRRRAGARARRPPAGVRGARHQLRSLAAAGVAGDRRRRPGRRRRWWPRPAVESRGAWSPDGADDRLQLRPPGRDEHLAPRRRRRRRPPAHDRAGRRLPADLVARRPGAGRSSRRARETATSGRVSVGRRAAAPGSPTIRPWTPIRSSRPTDARSRSCRTGCGRTEVWVMNADGVGAAAADARSGPAGTFSAGPAMAAASYSARRAGRRRRSMRVSVDDRALTRLPDVSSGGHMSWSPDQSLILDVRGHRTLWVYPAGRHARRGGCSSSRTRTCGSTIRSGRRMGGGCCSTARRRVAGMCGCWKVWVGGRGRRWGVKTDPHLSSRAKRGIWAAVFEPFPGKIPRSLCSLGMTDGGLRRPARSLARHLVSRARSASRAAPRPHAP